MGRRTKGEGSITRLRDGRWQARITVHQDGKTKRRAYYGKTATEARQKLTKALQGHDDGLPLPSDRLTVAAYLPQWLAGKKDLRPGSWRRYSDSIRLHLVPYLGRKPLSKLTPGDLRACYGALRLQGLSSTTVALIHGTLRTALQDAAVDGLVARNVAALVKAPPRSTTERRPLTAAEAHRLLDAASGDPLEAFYIVALTTGLRLGELLALQWANVDLDKGRLRVVATLAGIEDGAPILAPPKTERSWREVTLSSLSVEALRRHRAVQLEARLTVAQHYTDHGLVFANDFGRPLDGSHVSNRHFRRLVDRAGLPSMRFHDLRHAAASLLLAEGVGVKVISEVLGHADVGVTLKVYAHLLPSAQDAAAEAMDRMFAGR